MSWVCRYAARARVLMIMGLSTVGGNLAYAMPDSGSAPGCGGAGGTATLGLANSVPTPARYQC
jgi:hypothetical protein